MSVLPLCLEPHPALRRVARPVTTFGSDLRQFARDLMDTMYAHDGIGLAAPQVGKDLRMFVANPSRRRGDEVVVVNPTLELSTGRAGVVEGCLSVPEVWERVHRAARVRLHGQDERGAPILVEGEGLLAIVLQHEVDHLQGRLFIDRLPWFRRRRLAARARPHTKGLGVGAGVRPLDSSPGLPRLRSGQVGRGLSLGPSTSLRAESRALVEGLGMSPHRHRGVVPSEAKPSRGTTQWSPGLARPSTPLGTDPEQRRRARGAPHAACAS